MSFRTIAAGAGMLAAVSLAATASAPAETGAAAATSSVHAHAAKPQHRVVKKQRETANARHGRRTRLALVRHRHRASDESADEIIRRPTTPVREVSVAAREQTSVRRFREFLNPQSFAISVSEELRGPRLLAAHFSGEMADPEVVLASLAGPIGADPHEDAAPSVAGDQTTGDDSPSGAPALAHSDTPPVVQRAAPAEKEPERMSFLRWFFVAWGGVLTFASAVRMAVG